MKIPKNMTEEEVVSVIEKVAGRIASKFVFGYHTFEDIKQQGIYEGLKGLAKYDEVRPLENFLAVHIKNRLCNFKRDNFVRIDKPCFRCPFDAYIKATDCCTKYENVNNCEPYSIWFTKNEARRNIMNPINIHNTVDDNERNMKIHENPVDNVSYKELVDLIDLNIPVLFRPDWIKLKNSVRISKIQRVKIIEQIMIIFKENGINVPESWSIIN